MRRRVIRGHSALASALTTLAVVGAILVGAAVEVGAESEVGVEGDAGADDSDSEPVSLHTFEPVQYPDVRGITQDRQGFMWLGANHQVDGGLIRHDGYADKRYTHDLADHTSLSHDQISVTYLDNDGVLWVGTIRGGLNRYNAEADNFTRFMHANDDTSLPSDDIKAIVQAADGTLWVGTEVGLARLDSEIDTNSSATAADAETVSWTSFVHDPGNPNSLVGNRVQAIVEDPSTGELWIGTNAGLSILDPTTSTFRNYVADDNPTALADDSVRAIERDAEGVWWLGTGTGISRYNPSRDDFTTMGQITGSSSSAGELPAVEAMLEDSQGRFWVGHGRGLHLFDRARGELVDFVDDPTREAVIGESAVHALFEDAERGIWIGTRISGVARISPVPRSLEYFRHDPADPTSINSDFVARVDATADGLWLVTDAGVGFFDGTEFIDYTTRFGLEDGWPSVHGILAPSDDIVWLGFNDGRVARVELDSLTVTYFEVPAPAHRAAIWPVAEATNGDLWYRVPWGFGVGVIRANGESELLIGDELDPDMPEQAFGFNTSHYFDVDNQLLWVTGLGLTRIDLNNSSVDVYPFVAEQPELVVNQLWSVDVGPDGHLWLASANGVHRFDPTTGEYVELYDDELPVTGATDARFGSDGRLWIVSVTTLTGLDPNTGDVVIYSASDESVTSGRLDMENWVASKLEVGPDGRMYAPTLAEGLVAFSPELVPNEPRPPPVALTGFELFGEEVKPGSDVMALPINLTPAINLGPEQNTFTFIFSALTYEHPDHNEFRYRLDGFDGDWQYTSPDRRLAGYTNVPPGDYTFRVEASNDGEAWSTNGASVAVTVAAPWYQTQWARFLGVLALVALVVAVVRWRTRQQRLKNRQLEERLAERVRHQEEREALLARVQEQSERLQGILAAAPVGVVLLGVERDVLIENKVAVDQLPALSEFDDAGHMLTFAGLSLDRLIAGHRAGNWTTTAVDVDGTARTITLVVRSIDSAVAADTVAGPAPDSDIATGSTAHGSDDQRRGWALIWEDITDLNELQQRRARQERLAAVGRFAAGIAHDVNNVLTVIGLNAELLSLDPGVSGRSREHVDRIARETGNASKFVSKILDFSRQSVSERELLDAVRVIGTQVRQLNEVIDSNIVLTFDGHSPATIWADPIQLERIVLNLVRNAQDAVGESGTIRVVVDHVLSDDEECCAAPSFMSTARSGESPAAWVRLAVIDDGSGIEAEVLPTIFEPFVSTKADGKGTGLGLAQVAGLAAEHDGYVTVDTEVGVGTTMSVWFPAADLVEFDMSGSLTTPGAGIGGDVIVGGDLVP